MPAKTRGARESSSESGYHANHPRVKTAVSTSADVPAETVVLSVRIKGYRISGPEQEFDRLNLQLAGRVDRDVMGLVYLLEPGPDLRPDFGGALTAADLPKPSLRGAEAEWTIPRSGKFPGASSIATPRNRSVASGVTPGENSSFDNVRWIRFKRRRHQRLRCPSTSTNASRNPC